MRKFISRYNRLVVCLLITAGTLALTFTLFSDAFHNVINSAVQLWNTLVTYFRFLIFFETPTGSPVVPPPCTDTGSAIPSDPSDFGSTFVQFLRLLFNGNNFTAYLRSLEQFLIIFVRVLPFAVALFFLLRKLYRRSLSAHNNDYNKDTRSLKYFKAVSSKTYVPTKRYFTSLWEYITIGSFTQNGDTMTARFRFPYLKIWLLIWLFNFNVFAVGLSAVATALYFSISFDFVALYHFLYTAFRLLLPAFLTIPFPVWIVVALWLVDRWRKKKALQRLRHMENMNKGFILDRSICTMLVGTMGKGKTTLVTDISLSTEAIFRNKAYELMLECDLKFPNFPYIVLENELKQAMDDGVVFNLASCGEWITAHENNDYYFSYDWEKYGLHYDDKKTLVPLWDVLRDYCKLYFIYIVNSSLIISNYAIRTDARKHDLGNMPLWDCDFFNRDSKTLHNISRQSHILDFDMLRLGKKLIADNKHANAFEFGVVAITETGKERGNQFKDKEIKETVSQLRATIKDLDRAKADNSTHKKQLAELTDRATQLTDKFNDSLKLIRHKCTVMGFPFARVFLDEQRPESLGADARDLCEIVHIRGKSELRLAMPFYFVGELVYAFIFPKFSGAYAEYRFNRGDNTLIMYGFKKLGACVHSAYSRIYNRFGYSVVALAVEDASTGQVLKESSYYLSNKKIYSNRFSTDAYGDIFADGLKKVKLGLDDIPEYETHKASEAELKSQNSYFINDIVRNANKEEA